MNTITSSESIYLSVIDLFAINNLLTNINGLVEALLSNMDKTTIVDNIKTISTIKSRGLWCL